MLMAISENNKKGVQFDIVDKLCNFLGVIPCEFFEYSPYIVKVNFSNDNIDNYDNGLHNIEINIKSKLRTNILFRNVHLWGDDNYIRVKKEV